MCLVGWGILQLSEFRKQVLASSAEAVETQPAVVDAIPETPLPDPTTQVAPDPAPTTDPWTESTTPATLEADAPDSQPTPIAATKPTPTIIVDAPDPAPPTPQEMSHQVDDLIVSGNSFLDAGQIVEGRTALNAALALLNDDPRADTLRTQLSSLNTPVFLGTALFPEDPAATYVDIQSGDSFLKIGHRYNIPGALVAAINPGLNPHNLKPATGIKIIRGPFHIRLSKHNNRLDLYARDLYIRSYPAQLEPGNVLPSGVYRIKPESKIQVAKRQWIGFEGADAATHDVDSGWLYGSPGPRAGESPQDQSTGLKLADEDLNQLFNLLTESHSLLRVDP